MIKKIRPRLSRQNWQRDFERNFCLENHAGCKTGLDNKHIMGYKERERSAQGDSLPAKGRREGLPRSAQREDAKLKQKETTIMDTFEKIRALLAEQLDIDPAKITMDSDIMGRFWRPTARHRGYGDDAGG
mgnify:CR=1 FL=1